MIWTEKEKEALDRVVVSTQAQDDLVRAVANKAAELLAARAGTMTAEDLNGPSQAEFLAKGWGPWRDRVLQHISAIGARNAVLEGLNKAAGEEIAGLKQEVERLEAERDEASNQARLAWDRQAEKDRAYGAALAERDAALKRAEAAEARVRQLAIAGQELSAAVDKHVGEPNPSTASNGSSATPGHPKRTEDLSDSITRDALMGDGFEKGAEAMRAACWEAVVSRLVRHGLQNLREDFKAAIEGVAP